MTLHHVSLGVTNMARSKAFYDAALKALGVVPLHVAEAAGVGVASVGYGVPGGAPSFWIGVPINRKPATAGNGAHVAFAAATREAVDAFYLAALDQGAADDGQPGLRSEYDPDYYAAFVRDPDGHKIEAVHIGE